MAALRRPVSIEAFERANAENLEDRRMTMIRKVMPAQVSALGDDEVEVILSTATVARDGHIIVPAGVDLTNYRANPIFLWQHDPEHPVGRAEDIQVDGDKIKARVRFAPTGISHKADEEIGRAHV